MALWMTAARKAIFELFISRASARQTYSSRTANLRYALLVHVTSVQSVLGMCMCTICAVFDRLLARNMHVRVVTQATGVTTVVMRVVGFVWRVFGRDIVCGPGALGAKCCRLPVAVHRSPTPLVGL